MDQQRTNESTRATPVVVAAQDRSAASRPAPDHAAPLLTLATYEKPDGWKRHPLTRVDLGIFLLLAAAAVLVRWPLILRGETLLQSDEAIVGLMAQDIAEGRALPIYFYGQRYMGALEAYVVAALLPLFGNPLHALRFGPACFFALLTGVQYLMLTRWFGRRGGLVGAAALLAASPMFALWSISARGGYIEILLWGSGVLWAYSEWLVGPRPAAHHGRQRFLFGLLLGSGLWINPSIVLFVLPVLTHALLHRPLALVEQSPTMGRKLRAFRGSFGRCSLPLLLVAAILSWNVMWAVSVEEFQVRHHVLLDALPKPIAVGVLVAAAAVGGIALARRTNLLLRSRQLLQASGLLMVGLIVGVAPALVYIVQTTIGLRPLEPTLPLGFRFLWRIGDSTLQLWHGPGPAMFWPD